ncbi:hypothetical protein DFJ73DRAFT_956826 [Zopfochytrium polystomum]|nr:hypothetical protein DFJ73DRAFT_956826 [Zopfochytrium polystomum]
MLGGVRTLRSSSRGVGGGGLPNDPDHATATAATSSRSSTPRTHPTAGGPSSSSPSPATPRGVMLPARKKPAAATPYNYGKRHAETIDDGDDGWGNMHSLYRQGRPPPPPSSFATTTTTSSFTEFSLPPLAPLPPATPRAAAPASSSSSSSSPQLLPRAVTPRPRATPRPLPPLPPIRTAPPTFAVPASPATESPTTTLRTRSPSPPPPPASAPSSSLILAGGGGRRRAVGASLAAAAAADDAVALVMERCGVADEVEATSGGGGWDAAGRVEADARAAYARMERARTGGHSVGRAAVAVLLAAERQDVTTGHLKKQLYAHSQLSKRDMDQAVVQARSLLAGWCRGGAPLTMDALAVRTGCEHLTHHADRVFARFAQRQKVQEGAPLMATLVAVVFYATAVAAGVKLKVEDVVGPPIHVDKGVFQSLVACVQETCPDELRGVEACFSRPTRQRSAAAAAGASPPSSLFSSPARGGVRGAGAANLRSPPRGEGGGGGGGGAKRKLDANARTPPAPAAAAGGESSLSEDELSLLPARGVVGTPTARRLEARKRTAADAGLAGSGGELGDGGDRPAADLNGDDNEDKDGGGGGGDDDMRADEIKKRMSNYIQWRDATLARIKELLAEQRDKEALEECSTKGADDAELEEEEDDLQGQREDEDEQEPANGDDARQRASRNGSVKDGSPQAESPAAPHEDAMEVDGDEAAREEEEEEEEEGAHCDGEGDGDGAEEEEDLGVVSECVDDYDDDGLTPSEKEEDDFYEDESDEPNEEGEEGEAEEEGEEDEEEGEEVVVVVVDDQENGEHQD